jgi:hypothetical protein
MPDDATFERRRRAQLAYADALDAVRSQRGLRRYLARRRAARMLRRLRGL